MKKIVSMLAVAALAFSSVFAAEVSIEYNTKGNLYSEKKTREATDEAVNTKGTSKSVFDQSGYADAQSDLVISATTDFAGVVLDIDPNASNTSTKPVDMFDQYYAWMNFGNIQVTSGVWSSRYVNRVKADAGNWESKDFERYKPGVINGKYASDIDNVTKMGDGSTKDENSNYKYTQDLATAIAYTLRPDDSTYFMVKGFLVSNGKWGGSLRVSGDDDYTYGDDEYDNYFYSSPAAEIAFRKDGIIDINAVVKSQKRDQLALGLFVRPLPTDTTNILFGFSYGTDLNDKDVNGVKHSDVYDRNYSEMAFDFRLRHAFSDTFALTTMNNLSFYQDAKVKDGSDIYAWRMWNMVSGAYKVSEQLLAQLTIENECGIQSSNGSVTYKVGDLGGFDISVIPGVTYSFNENASLTAGVRFRWSNVGASDDYVDANGKKTEFSIPVVFDVAL